MSIKRIDEELCNGCGNCIDACPVDVLRMGEQNKAIIAYAEDCTSCFTCVFDCPPKAIEVASQVPLALSIYEITDPRLAEAYRF